MTVMKRLSALLVAAILVSLFAPLCSSALDELTLDIKAAILMNSETGEVIYSKDSEKPYHIAETAVVMTALLAFEAAARGDVSLSDTVTASAEALEGIPEDAETQKIQPGEKMSLESLLYCALVCSAADACNVIAQYISGDLDTFIKLMNDRAAELGCKNTRFVNANGVENNEQFSSARDLALIASAAAGHDKFMEICNTVTIEVTETNLSAIRLLDNSNYLIRPDYPRYYYSYACGIKNGYSETGGHCLISAVNVDGIYVVSVTLGGQLAAADNGYYEIRSFTETRKLFKWFFLNYSYRDIISPIEPIVEVPIALAEGTDTVVARVQEGLSMFLPNDLKLSETFKREITIYSQQEGAEKLKAPISEGTVLGEMTVSFNGETYGPFTLVANTDVQVSKLELMRANLSSLMKNPLVSIIFWVVIIVIVLYIAFVIQYNRRRAKKRREFNKLNENSVTTIPRKKP
ncbi:MAG: D-alanyl-D-alanine carboxypeptidase [Papillibacter sp.]|jgi:D-alanyl-D-alanine carboxypeptidase (penicillin-binding protein 5/6)|nr:D-alanyl-D-alanine carboxypeptidase [Papillibacter sp.]